MSFFYMERGPRIIKYVRGENAQFKIQQEKKSQKIKQIVNNLQNWNIGSFVLLTTCAHS